MHFVLLSAFIDVTKSCNVRCRRFRSRLLSLTHGVLERTKCCNHDSVSNFFFSHDVLNESDVTSMELWFILFSLLQRHDGYYLDGICNFVVCRVSVEALRNRIIDGPSAASRRISVRSSVWRFCSYYNFLIQKSINVNVNFKEICDKNFYFITMKEKWERGKKMSLIFIPE